MQRENKWQDRVRKYEQLFWEKIPDDLTLQKEMYETQIKPHFEFCLKEALDTARAEERGRIVKEIEKLPELITSVTPGGILPFVIFGGKATEEEKATIYFQAFKDIIKLIKQ